MTIKHGLKAFGFSVEALKLGFSTNLIGNDQKIAIKKSKIVSYIHNFIFYFYTETMLLGETFFVLLIHIPTWLQSNLHTTDATGCRSVGFVLELN